MGAGGAKARHRRKRRRLNKTPPQPWENCGGVTLKPKPLIDGLTHGVPSMATSQSDDVEELINRLCGPLSAGDRGDFRRAAEAALAQLPCSGPGIAFRTLRELFRSYFHPPDDHAVCGPRHQRRSRS